MKPMLAQKVGDNAHGVRLCTDDNWWVEPKFDGERRLITIEGEVLRNYNRKGERGGILPDKIATWFEPFDGDWAFDGELMGNGHFIMFDLVHANDLITETTPYYQRRAALEAVYAKAFGDADTIHLAPVGRTSEEKVALCRKIAEQRGEGMMFKHIDAPYVTTGRRSYKTLKWKYWKTADLICGIVGRNDSMSVQLLAVDKETAELVDVGSAATMGKGELERGDVVEVRYLYLSDGDRLYQPTILRKRTDKDAASCWTDQLETTSKYAYEG